MKTDAAFDIREINMISNELIIKTILCSIRYRVIFQQHNQKSLLMLLLIILYLYIIKKRLCRYKRFCNQCPLHFLIFLIVGILALSTSFNEIRAIITFLV